MTEQVLMEIYRQIGGDLNAVADTAAIATALNLTRDEVSSACRALEVTGLIAFTSEISITAVQMTTEGMARCRQHGEASRS